MTGPHSFSDNSPSFDAAAYSTRNPRPYNRRNQFLIYAGPPTHFHLHPPSLCSTSPPRLANYLRSRHHNVPGPNALAISHSPPSFTYCSGPKSQ